MAARSNRQTALDRLVPSAWKLPNGEPKQWLEKAGFLTAVRATNIGADYRARLESENPPEVAAALLNETVKEGILQAWGKLKLRPEPPKAYLVSWRAILVALGLHPNTEDLKKVRNLNAQYGGPIVIPTQGAQAKVERTKLVEWWNGLEIQWSAGFARSRDAKPTVQQKYNYGRRGVVVPEIRGQEKRRRGDRKK